MVTYWQYLLAWLRRRVKQFRLILCALDFHGGYIGMCDVKIELPKQRDAQRMLRYRSYLICKHCKREISA